MLVLSRKPPEEIVVRVPPSDSETEITVTLISIRHGKARIGLEADRSVVIHRSEIMEAIENGESKCQM